MYLDYSRTRLLCVGFVDANVVALKRAVVSFTIGGLQRSASLMPAGHATATGGLVHLHDGIAYGLQLLLFLECDPSFDGVVCES